MIDFNKEIKCAKCGARMDIKPLDNSRGSVHCSFCSNIVFYEVVDSKIIIRGSRE